MSAGLHVESVGAGPPLVLLHGWAMHSGLWGPLLAHLSRRYRVHAVDLPGHGHSGSVAPYTLEALTAAIVHRFRTETAPLAVIGWSLGGLPAMRWALQAPERISGLVLVSTSPRFVMGEDWPHAMAGETLLRFGDELRVSYRLTIQRFLTLQMRGSTDAHAGSMALRRQLFARGEPAKEVLADALAILRHTDLRREVPAIAPRTLVIAGDRDTLVPLPAAQWLAATLAKARLAAIAGAAHVPFLSHPQAFNAALDAFLDEC